MCAKGDVWLDVCEGAICVLSVCDGDVCILYICESGMHVCCAMSVCLWVFCDGAGCVFVYVIRLSVCCEGGTVFVYEKKDLVAKIYQFKMNTCFIDSLHAYSRYSTQLWIISFTFDYAVINGVTWMLFCDIIRIWTFSFLYKRHHWFYKF